MNFVKKIKDILFEEEDVTTEIDTVEKPVSEPKIVKIESLKNDDYDFIKDEEEVEEEKVEKTAPVPEVKPEVEVKENSFLFPDFDEEEFASSMSRSRQNVNVLDYERKKVEDKRNDYPKYDRGDSQREYDRKKFKPSPIISPVYGILNQDYKAEDIVNREDVASNIDIDVVRKKAFEPTILEEETPRHSAEDAIDEPVVTFFEEKKEEVVEEDNKEEHKSINELLDDASTEVSLEDTLEVPTTNNLEAIEEELEKLDEEEKKEPQKEEPEEDPDNDLFELIDSMYDDREEV